MSPFDRSTSVLRRWLAAAFAVAALLSNARAQTIEGQPIAAQFGEYRVTDEGNGFSFIPEQCNVLGAGQNFPAFTTGVPVKVWDPRPGLTEISTQVTAFVTGSYCAVSLGGLLNPHLASFYLTSGSGGLQEALNNSKVPAGITTNIILNSRWYELIAPRTAAQVISSVTGSASFGLVDITTNPYTSYNWTGSQYVAVSTAGSGAVFPTAGGLVYSTSATASRPATSADVSSLIAGATVAPAVLDYTIYAAGVNGAGIGGAQTAWSSGTAYPQCSAVSSSGSNYLAVAANSSVTPGTNKSIWWQVPNANTPTNGDCAFYLAASQVNGPSGAELILPSGNTNTCIGFMEPTVTSPGYPNVVIEGAGKHASTLTQTCNIVASGNAVVQQPNSGVAYALADVDWESFTVNANFLASAAMNVYGAQQFKIKHIALENAADGSDHYIEFGHPAAANHALAWTYEMDLEDIDTLNSHGPGGGANITASVSGGVPTFTVLSGGSSFNPTYAQLILAGTGSNADTPCTNRGTDTINVSGGTISSIATTATGCASPLYASVFGGNAVTYCFKFNDASDSKMIMALTPSECHTGVYNSNISSLMSFTKTHVIATMVGITDAGNNSYWATQLDSIYRYGFDFEGAGNTENIYGTKFEWATNLLPGSSDYHFGTISNPPINAPYAINIFGDACGDAATFGGYYHFLSSSGTALPPFLHAYDSVSCDQTASPANTATYSGQTFSLGDGVQAVASGSANQNSPTFQAGGNYWNAAASVPSNVQLQLLFGSGSNPSQTAQFSMGGVPSSGSKSYAFDNPIVLKGASSGSATLSASSTGGILNVGSTDLAGVYFASAGQSLQSLINTVDTAGGGTIMIGPGDFSGGGGNTLVLPGDGHCVNLVGSGAGVSTVAPISQATVATMPYGCRLENLTINGGYPAHSPSAGIYLTQCKGCIFRNIAPTYIAPAGDGVKLSATGSAGANVYESVIDNIACEFDPSVYTSSALEPNYCLHMASGATDNNSITRIVARNVALAAVKDEAGGANFYSGVHQYGTTQALQASYTMDITGNTIVDAIESDGVNVAGINVTGNNVSITNSKFQWTFATAGAVAIQFAGGLDSITVTGNTWPTVLSNPGVTAPMAFLGSLPTTFYACGNHQDYSQCYHTSPIANNLTLSGSLTITGLGTSAAPVCPNGTGGALTTTGCAGGGGGPASFSAITSGTNGAAAMVVGSGASVAASGSGTIAATSVPFSGVTGTPTTTQVPVQSISTTGSSGAATLSAGVLNIPQYAGGTGLTTVQTNGTNNASQSALNFITSTTNAAGLTVTPSNPATSSQKAEVAGTVNATSGGTGMNSSTSNGVPQVASGAWSVSTALPSGLSATNMILTTPVLGTPSAAVLTNATGLPWTGLTGTPSVAQVPVQSLTTTGSSGAATLSGGVLNVPQYAGGSGAVSSVSNSDQTLTVTPTTGPVVASLNLGHQNTWTATQIFSVAGAASASGVSITGAPYTGGTATTNFPQFYLNQGAAVTTLSTTGTEFGINAPSGFTGHLLNFFVNGGSTRFRVDYAGNMFAAGTSTVTSTLTAGSMIDSALGTSTSPVCPNGTGGALTTTGCAGGGSSAFSGLTGGTNTAAAMVVGSGASLAASGTGTIAATSVPFSGVTGTPTTTQVPVQSITTTGSAGAATLSAGVLNIPQYSGGTGLTTVQTNGTNNASQSALNFITSTTNAAGLTVTPSNPATSSQKTEVAGTVNATSGGTGMNSSALTGVPQVTSGAWSVSTTLPNSLSATNMNLVTPALGTPSAVTLTHGTGLPWTGLTGTPSTTQVPVQSITTTGSAGAATLSGGVLNIPQYSGGGSSVSTFYVSNYGAVCDGSLVSTGIVTTSGSATISVQTVSTHYDYPAFVFTTAMVGDIIDLDQSQTNTGGSPTAHFTSTITSVNTGSNTATLAANVTFTSASGYGGAGAPGAQMRIYHTDNKTAIQNALNAANRAVGQGSSNIVFPPGVCVASGPLVFYSNQMITGAGPAASIVMLANGSNSDLFLGYNFSNLTTTGSGGGLANNVFADIQLDGNKGQNTGSGIGTNSGTGDAIRFYGYGFWTNHLVINNFAGDGWYSEWNTGAGDPTNGFNTENSYVNNAIFANNAGYAITYGGPHDGYIQNTTITNSGTGAILQYAGTNISGSPLNLHSIHTYQNQGFDLSLLANVFLETSDIEGTIQLAYYGLNCGNSTIGQLNMGYSGDSAAYGINMDNCAVNTLDNFTGSGFNDVWTNGLIGALSGTAYTPDQMRATGGSGGISIGDRLGGGRTHTWVNGSSWPITSTVNTNSEFTLTDGGANAFFMNSNQAFALGPSASAPATGVHFDLHAMTDSMLLPTGTTGQRPGTGVAGMLRYNSSTPGLEAYYNGTWNALGSGGGGGGGGTTTNALTFSNSGSGAASGATFNGSAAVTASYNSIGAQQALTLTTTGSSGAATLSGGALNIPQYAGGGGSGVSQIIPGTNVTISPSGGTGAVTVNATGSGTGTGTPAVPAGGYIVSAGDSLCTGYQISGAPALSWPNQLATLLGISINNTCRGGYTLAEMQGDYTSLVAPTAPNTTGHPAILYISIYGNDIGNIGTGLTYSNIGAYETALANYINPAISAGYKIGWLAQWPQTGRQSSDALRIALNEWARTSTLVNYYVDMTGRMNTPTNTELYNSDGQHPNLLASTEIAQIAYNNLFSGGNGSSWNNFAFENSLQPYVVTVDNAAGPAAQVRNVDTTGNASTQYIDSTDTVRFEVGYGNASASSFLKSVGGLNIYTGGSTSPTVTLSSAGGLAASAFTANGTAANTYIGSGSASNTDLDGILASTGTSVAYTFQRSPAYTSHPICTGAAEGTTPVSYAVSYSGVASVTFTFSASFTGNWDYLCVARN